MDGKQTASDQSSGLTDAEYDDRMRPVVEAGGGLSDEAAAHVGELILHRPETDDLTIVLHPARCAWCREIAEAWLGTDRSRS